MLSSDELRCQLLADSQMGWCLLKSPNHSITSFLWGGGGEKIEVV